MSSELIHKNEKLASMRSISIQANCGRERLFPPIFIDGIWDDKGNHLVSLFVNDDEYIEYYGNILFIYDTVNHKYIKSIYY